MSGDFTGFLIMSGAAHAVARDLTRGDPATARTVAAAKNDPDERLVGVLLTAKTIRTVLAAVSANLSS